MGMIMQDNQRGVHCEVKRESFVLYTDFGVKSLELKLELLSEVRQLLDAANDYLNAPLTNSCK